MCGIAGIFAYGDAAPPVDQAELLRIREAMINRGPDGAGLWTSSDRRVGLAHRRLAIIDVSETGAQPMATDDGQLRITFNGEIYNYRALRRELEVKGVRFRSESDTEVLLHLYADQGMEMVHALRGMFAFGIWDERKRGLFLARDPFGIKPLYYIKHRATLRFASQVKALVAGGCVELTADPAGRAGFYLWGHIPEPFTLYREVQALPAGTTLWQDQSGHHEEKRYVSISEIFASAEAAPSGRDVREMKDELRRQLLDSVKHHLVADVPVGVFLSSGKDSSTLAALAREFASRLHTITLGVREFKGTKLDEVPVAEQVARNIGAIHKTIWIGRSDFESEFEKFMDSMDQPSVDGVNSYFVAKAASEAGLKVALSGLGGDEVFGGYSSFAQIPQLVKMTAMPSNFPGIGRGFRRVTAPLLKHFMSPKWASVLEYGNSFQGAYLLRRGMFMPWELPDLMGPDATREGWARLQPLMRLKETAEPLKSPYLKVSALELCWYMRNQLLRDTDWAAMAHSLEVRVPLIDLTLLRAIAPMLATPLRPTKYHLATTPAKQLPKSVLSREKIGFSVPVRDWLLERGPQKRERGLRGWSKTVLPQNRGMNILSLVTEAFGGHGGISQYNRDVISALCSSSDVENVVAIPRSVPNLPGNLPTKLKYKVAGSSGKIRFLLEIVRTLFHESRPTSIHCGHINLLPLAVGVKLLTGAPVNLFIYGIDAWTPRRALFVRALMKQVTRVVSISAITADRFSTWSKTRRDEIRILPNAIHLDWYGVTGKSRRLLERYNIAGNKVIATFGRLVAEERYKGFDEVLEIMPRLVSTFPRLTYLIMGDGSDRVRLEAKVASLGIAEHVVFTGFVEEAEKAEHLNLLDAFVMPSKGEGFGFVVLEALACGVPVIGSTVDGTREALRDGALGKLVDPDRPDELLAAIQDTLRSSAKGIPAELEYFRFEKFRRRLYAICVGPNG